jgi:hypothetical protein
LPYKRGSSSFNKTERKHMSHAQDAATISDEKHELDYVAKKYNCTVDQVKQAKKDAGTNERQAVYTALEKILGK